MELVLRKRSSGDTLRLRGAKVLCHRSRKLAFLAPYAGQWVFYSLTPPASAQLLFNNLPAPPRCPVAAGDLLNLNGLELVVDAVEVDPGADPLSETGAPPLCEISMAGGRSIRVTHDLLIGPDPCCVQPLAARLDVPPLTALLAFAAGRWHLHELNGNSLFHNGEPTRRSLVLSDRDCVRIGDKELHFRIGGAARLKIEELGVRNEEKKNAPRSSPCKPAKAAPSSQEIDLVYQKATALLQELLPVVRDPGRKFQPRQTSRGGIRGWLRILRRPADAAETLERLQFLLSGSPRDRVWLFELAHFLFQQSYHSLCLRLLKELCRLYPRDVTVRQTLAKFYYQQGCNTLLPAEGRLNALEHAEHCTQVVRRLAPNDRSLADLERAIRMEQTIVRRSRADVTPCEAPLQERAEAIGRIG